MQLLGKLEIKSKEKIIEFLSSQQTGRISSIDENGFPQIIPMNFVFINNAVTWKIRNKIERKNY